MLNNVIRVSFTVVGAITGVSLTKTFFYFQNTNIVPGMKVGIYILVSLFIAIIFYSTGNRIIELTLSVLDKLETNIQKMTLYELTVSAFGLIIGLIIANLITMSISKVYFIGVPFSVAANILFGCLGIGIAARKRNETVFDFIRDKNRMLKNNKNLSGPKVLDTSVIIDGRIVDICRTGFLSGELVIPGFVLDELRHIADSTESLKRNRGKRGLDVLNILQKEMDYPVKIENIDATDESEVDLELLKLAQKLHADIVTVDYNLNKVACLHGVTVLNVNELANAVKPIALPGEEMVVQVIKDGKENGQGIGYLEDGTMIVVDGGRRHVGESVSVMVTSVLQTAAGRMIFAKTKYSIERVI